MIDSNFFPLVKELSTKTLKLWGKISLTFGAPLDSHPYSPTPTIDSWKALLVSVSPSKVLCLDVTNAPRGEKMANDHRSLRKNSFPVYPLVHWVPFISTVLPCLLKMTLKIYQLFFLIIAGTYYILPSIRRCLFSVLISVHLISFLLLFFASNFFF